MFSKLFLTSALLLPLAVAAQPLPTAPYLPLSLASKAAQAAVDACSKQGHNVSVAVVGRDGETKVLLKADNSGPHTGNSAQGKDRKSTRLNSSHVTISYAVFSLKKKKY